MVQARRFFPDFIISIEVMDMFKSTSRVIPRDGFGTSTSDTLY